MFLHDLDAENWVKIQTLAVQQHGTELSAVLLPASPGRALRLFPERCPWISAASGAGALHCPGILQPSLPPLTKLLGPVTELKKGMCGVSQP